MRRVLCVALCACLLTGLATAASAATWMHITNNQLQATVTCYLIDTVASNTTSLASNFSYAVDYWDDLPQVNITEVDYYTGSFSASGAIVHTAPRQGFWDTASDHNANILGLCHMYNQAGTNIYSFFENSNGVLINNAVVYYNPSATVFRNLNYSSNNFRCLHAHETGHAFGLTHIASGAVMSQGINDYSALQSGDINKFKTLYGFN